MKQFLFLVMLSACFPYATSHSGGLDTHGGHTNKSTGVYHCHRTGCESAESNNSQPNRYDRDDWPHWLDSDGDCMNTRHEMLLEQADGAVIKSPDGCYVSAGTWIGPFSGKTFQRASDLDVDHIIPLKWAHENGGREWSRQQKAAFANDPLNLLVVDDGLNQSKGAKGPSQWMPPNHQFRCEYLHRWQLVLYKYPRLSMTSNEARTFNRQIEACGLYRYQITLTY